MEEKLQHMQLPKSMQCRDLQCQSKEHSQERDRVVLDILSTIIEVSHTTIPLSKGGNQADSKPGPNNNAIPGWKELVAPEQKAAKFWHAIWTSSGKPNTGGLYSVMKWTKHKYHYAVRRAKRQISSLRAKELHKAAEQGDRAFMEELKKTLGKKKEAQVIPEKLEGEVTTEGILDKFRDMYKDLYNSAGTQEEMVHVKKTISDRIAATPASEYERLTAEVVKKACAKMKPGKKDVSGSYSSDVFLHGPDNMFSILAEVFKSFLIHGTVSEQILACAFLPL